MTDTPPEWAMQKAREAVAADLQIQPRNDALVPTPSPSGAIMTILERLKAATGPDRGIDMDVLESTGGCAHKETEYYCIEDGNDYDSGYTCKKCGADTYGAKIDRYTASIDAALALVERMLPGWNFQLFNNHNKGGWMARLRSPSYELHCTNVVDGEERRVSTAPIAILLALFSALEAKEITNADE